MCTILPGAYMHSRQTKTYIFRNSSRYNLLIEDHEIIPGIYILVTGDPEIMPGIYVLMTERCKL